MAVATKPLQVPAMTTVGPEIWRNKTLKTINLTQSVVNKSNKSNDIGRALDPVPHIRDIVASLSNEQARRYFRDTRVVVFKLRQSLLDTNEEIKALTRGKESLEKALEHIRKDLKLNKDSQSVRTTRPNREKEHDGADDLLNAERQHLLNCKKRLEDQLRLVQEQLQVLEQARRRLFAVLQERNRVLDLLCHAHSSVTHSQEKGGRPGALDGKYTTIDNNRLSASDIDALSPYTPEADQSLQGAQDARSRSAYLRKALRETIDQVEQLQKAAHKSVNDGLTKKVAETEALRQHLGVTFGENRHALNRAKRWFETTERAWGFTRGPMMTEDLFTRERLERPIIKVFQRHPGNQMPEAQDNIKSGDGLLNSMTATSRNIGLMYLTQHKIKEDLRSKSAGSCIDSSVIRMRRSKANHRWPLSTAFCTPP